MDNQFWEAPTFDKNILIIPNYTHFGGDKDINSDSFVLVMDKFLTYRKDRDWETNLSITNTNESELKSD